MSEFGLAARIALIVTAALFVSQLAAVFSAAWQQGSSPFPPHAIAQRVVSVVRLLEGVPADERDTALAVANVTGFLVTVEAGDPPGFVDVFSFGRVRQAVQAQLDENLPGRTVRAGLVEGDQGARGDFTYMFLIGLETGETAVVTVSDERTLRFLNIPIGFLASFLGIIVALLAVLAVRRETRPIVQLARSVDELGNSIAPVPVKERGARETRTLIRAINNMQGRILGLVNNRTVFLGAISHDLKTYLTRFRLRLELMPPGKHRDRAVLDVDEMEQILNDVLFFASESAASMDDEMVDVGEAVRRRAAEANLEQKRVAVGQTQPGLFVHMPRRALHRVVDNLLSNAIRYGESATISTERSDGKVRIVVEDNGPGIPEKDLQEVFEPFFTVDPSRNRRTGGTGLGLSIVRQILDAHGGGVTLANRGKAKGLRATVDLPLASGEATERNIPERPA